MSTTKSIEIFHTSNSLWVAMGFRGSEVERLSLKAKVQGYDRFTIICHFF